MSEGRVLDRHEADFTAVSGATFRDAMADLPAPICLVTTTDANGLPRGATVSAVSSLSVNPPQIVLCLKQTSDTLSALPAAQNFLLHVAADGQQDVAKRLAGKGDLKFEHFAWKYVFSRLPLIEGYATVLLCRVEKHLPGGDHTIIVASALNMAQRSGSKALIFHRRTIATSPV